MLLPPNAVLATCALRHRLPGEESRTYVYQILGTVLRSRTASYVESRRSVGNRSGVQSGEKDEKMSVPVVAAAAPCVTVRPLIAPQR